MHLFLFSKLKSTILAGLSSALFFTGEVTSGEERNHQKMVFLEKTSLPGRWLGQPAGITSLSGNLFFMASEKVILLVTA